MAARNIKLLLSEFAPTGFDKGTPAQQRRWRARFAELALAQQRAQIRAGIGADGKPLKPVLPASRPDGADGKPLDPHYAESRTYRLLACTSSADGWTLYWRGHGRRSWSTILGYHADGMVRGAPVRDVIGMADVYRKRLKRESDQFWRNITRKPKRATPRPAPKPVQPAPQVKVLKPGAKPNPRSRKVQVYEVP